MIDASSIERINTHLEDIGAEANISSSTKPSDTLRWLAHLKENWILLLDNADDPKIDLHPFFPACSHGNIIVTSRNPECATHAFPPQASWKVSDLTLDDAIELLFLASGRRGKDDSGQAVVLVQELGLLALAIVQAGSYITRNIGLTFSGYLDRYRTNRDRLLRTGPNQRVDSYVHTVYTTWEMSFEKLDPVAKSLLQLCGFLHREGIATDIFERAALVVHGYPEVGKQPYHQSATEFLDAFITDSGNFDTMSFDDVLIELASFSLIQRSALTTFSIHPLVHSWSRDRLSQEGRDSSHRLALAILSLSIAPGEHASDFAHRRLLLPHMDAALPTPLSLMDVGIAERFARGYDLQGRWKQTSELYRIVVAGQKSPLDVRSIHNLQSLARALSLQGDEHNAELLSVALVEESKQVLGLEHPDTLKSMASLATTYYGQGRYSEAESIEVEVLALRRRVLGSEHPETLSTMANLASTYSARGRYSEAKHLKMEVLTLRKRVMGSEHPDTLSSMANVAVTYYTEGQYKEAEALLLEVLELRKQVLGSEHPDTWTCMAHLASLYSAQGRHSEAEPLKKEVLELRRRLLGPEHPNTLNSMSNLASTYLEQGRLSEAEPLQIEVLALRKRILGSEHPETLHSIANLAATYSAQGRHSGAEPLIRRS